MSAEEVIARWGDGAAVACAGRHVLAIQDTSEINFRTHGDDRRGLGKIGKGHGYGVLLHAMMAVDAHDGSCLGLVSGRVWTRQGLVQIPHAERDLADKESERWLSTASAAKDVLAQAAMVTVVADRESDIYEEWAHLPEPEFHLLTRAMCDRRIEGGKLSTAALAPAGSAAIALRARPGRPARTVRLEAAFGAVRLKRPRNGRDKTLPETIELTLIEVIEHDHPPGAEPIHWRLLTTHRPDAPAAVWRIVEWYRARWAIEQLFRTLKQQGLRLEDSQIEEAGKLIKLTALAAIAACTIMQLVHARDGRSDQTASLAFTPAQIDTLTALVPTLEGKTKAQKNHHPPRSLAWAAWAIAKLGGWDGYASSKPPGPITFAHGLQYFLAISQGHQLNDV